MVQSAMHSFRNRVEEFLGKTGLNDVERLGELRKEIVRLAMQIQDGLGSLKLRKITHDYGCFDEFNHFKNQYLDVSYHLHRKLWREVIKSAKETKDAPKSDPDVQYCLSNLSSEDLKKLKSKQVMGHLDVDNIDLNKWQTGKVKKKDIMAYARSKVSSLNFLVNYDPAIDSEDHTQELLCELVRVFNTYPRSKCKNLPVANADITRLCVDKSCGHPATHGNKCEHHDLENRVQMYIEIALNNKVMNIKEYYTCESRRRVAATDHKRYKKLSKLRKEIQKHPKVRVLASEIEALTSVSSGQLEHLQKLLTSDSELNITPAQRQLLDLTSRVFIKKVSKNIAEDLSVVWQKKFKTKVDNILSSVEGADNFFKFSGNFVNKANRPEFVEKVDKLCDTVNLKTVLDKELDIRRNSLKKLVGAHPLTKDVSELDKQLKESDGDYYSTVVSLIRPADNDNAEKPLDISHDQVAVITGESDHSFGSVASLESKMWVDNLCENVTPSVARFIRIVTGEEDKEFEKWANDNHVDSSLFVTLINGAKRYLNIKTADLKKNPFILAALKH